MKWKFTCSLTYLAACVWFKMHFSEHQCAWIWNNLTVYHGYYIFVIFIQSLFFNHSEHKMLNISLCCLFCTQGAKHPKLAIIAANAAVSHHLLPFLMKEPLKKIIFFLIQLECCCFEEIISIELISRYCDSLHNILSQFSVLDFPVVGELVLAITSWNLQQAKNV